MNAEEYFGTHVDRGSGFTHHARDDCESYFMGRLQPPRDTRQCSRFTIHQGHNWGANSWCNGRTTDVSKMAGVGGPVEDDLPVPTSWATSLEANTLITSKNTSIAFSFTPPLPPPAPTLAQELASWYLDQARGEVEQLTAKMAEYGGDGRAVDLIQIGQDLAAISGREVDDEEAAELGVYFYLRGKLSRWTAALLEGRRVSDDTLHDIGVYVRMAQRIRQRGGWPV